MHEKLDRHTEFWLFEYVTCCQDFLHFLLGIAICPILNCSHKVQYLDCENKRLELTLQSLSPVLALYDPFGVDVPLNCDTTTTTAK